MPTLGSVTERLRTSLWFIPALFVIGALIGGTVTVAIDRQLGTSDQAFFLYGGSAAGARSVLSTIAQSMLTFTGLVFTVTMLVLQLASSQLSPRVLRTFLADRQNQAVLGLFVATFVYTLVVIRDVGGDQEGDFVPALSVWVSFVLLLASVAAFIYYINHMAHAIRASTVIASIADDTRAVIDRVYPERADGDSRELDAAQPQAVRAAGDWPVVRSDGAGAVVSVDRQGLIDVAVSSGAVVEVVPRTGDFVPENTPLLRVSRELSDAEADKLRSCVALGRERTMQQDVAFGLRQLVDVASRALSPSTNDPTTAAQAIDRLYDLLVVLANRPFPGPLLTGPDSKPRVVVNEWTWPEYVQLASEELTDYGTAHVQVVRRLAAMLAGVAEQCPVDRRQPLYAALDRLRSHVAEQQPALRADLERIIPSS